MHLVVTEAAALPTARAAVDAELDAIEMAALAVPSRFEVCLLARPAVNGPGSVRCWPICSVRPSKQHC